MIVDTTIPLWGLISLAISLLIGLYTFFATRRKDVEERFKQGSRRMDDLTRRMDGVEGTIRGMPGKDDIHQVQLELARMNGSMNEMRAIMGGNQEIMSRLEKIVARHEDHLLGGSK